MEFYLAILLPALLVGATILLVVAGIMVDHTDAPKWGIKKRKK